MGHLHIKHAEHPRTMGGKQGSTAWMGSRPHHRPAAARPLAHAAIHVAHVPIASLAQDTQRRARSILCIADQENWLVGKGRNFVQSLVELPHRQQQRTRCDAGGMFFRLADVDQHRTPRFVFSPSHVKAHSIARGRRLTTAHQGRSECQRQRQLQSQTAAPAIRRMAKPKWICHVRAHRERSHSGCTQRVEFGGRIAISSCAPTQISVITNIQDVLLRTTFSLNTSQRSWRWSAPLR